MGADLIMSFCPAPIYEDGTLVTDFATIREQVLARVGAWIDDEKEHDRQSIVWDYTCASDWDELHDTLLWCAADVVDAAESRECMILEPPLTAYPLVITGGMTWGDDPTSAFQPVLVIGETPIFGTPFRKEDT